MAEKPDIRNSKYKETLISLFGKSGKSGEQKVIGYEEITPEFSRIKKKMTQGVTTVVEKTTKEITETSKKVMQSVTATKDTFLDRGMKQKEDSSKFLKETVVGIKEPDWDSLVVEEMDSKGAFFAPMLNVTDELLASEVVSKENAEQLVKKWEFAFSAGELLGLSHKLAEAQQGENKDAKDQLKSIMLLFDQFGLKKLAIKNPVVVSPENRHYFDNGTQFPDGRQCEIVRWPWLYKEKIYYHGMLCETEE